MSSSPTVDSVIHAPIFPAPDQPVVVTAYIDDNGHLTSTLVYHRRDEDTLFDTAEMVDDGSGADTFAGEGNAFDMGAYEFFEFYSIYLPLALDKR